MLQVFEFRGQLFSLNIVFNNFYIPKIGKNIYFSGLLHFENIKLVFNDHLSILAEEARGKKTDMKSQEVTHWRHT